MSSVKIDQTGERTRHTFWAQVQFLSLFVSHYRTLKFLQVKCNPTIKKPVA